MKIALLACLVLLASCSKQEPQKVQPSVAEDEQRIEETIRSLYAGMEQVYNGGGANSDSLLSAFYAPEADYVTPWGWTEPLDSTKARLRNALGRVKDYAYRVEIVKVRSFGSSAYAFFILRQQYRVDGRPLDEYLPTTFVLERRGDGWKILHVHRSTDYETFQQYVALQQKSSKK